MNIMKGRGAQQTSQIFSFGSFDDVQTKNWNPLGPLVINRQNLKIVFAQGTRQLRLPTKNFNTNCCLQRVFVNRLGST